MSILEWLWRPQCAACGTLADEPLCDACAVTLVEADEPRSIGPLYRVVAPWRFGGQLASAVRRLKFAGATHVARTVAPLWSPVLEAALAELGDEALIVPVPLHWRRRFVRGFDQTSLLAHYACRLARVPSPTAALRRIRYTPPQSTLSAAEREHNLDGAFVVRDAREVEGRSIVLVDDVVTTGATLAAAAEPLVRAGCERILGVALARTGG
jgi:ComF family protein